MIFSKITIFGIVLASLSKSVCGNTENSFIGALLTLEQHNHPLHRDYIKTTDGGKRADEPTKVTCLLRKRISTLNSQWGCSFNDPGISMDFDGHSMKAIFGVDDEWLVSIGAESGTTMMVLSEAQVLPDRIIIEKANVVAIDEYHHNSIDRRLQHASGKKKTLVVRVNALDSSPPEATVLSENIFSDEYSLKTQFDRCSFGELTIQEYEPGTSSYIPEIPTVTDAPGVIDIFIDANAIGANVSDFEEYAESALIDKFDEFDEHPFDLFDVVMYCMPPGMVDNGTDWTSYAYIRYPMSVFNNEECLFLSHQMQEVGHIFGLDHSGEYDEDEEIQEYGDQTGYMGLTVNLDDDLAMCFNPAKSWQLGWYEDKTYEIDIISEISNEATSFTLNGVVDYEDTTTDRYIVVRLASFFIGFNRAESFNAGVQEAANQVTIVENLGKEGYATKSKLVSKLSVGDSYTIELTEHVSIDVEYVSISDGKDAVIEIKYSNEPILCEGEFDAEIEVLISTDFYPEEISWGVADGNGQFVHLTNYGDMDSSNLWTTTVEGLCRGLEYYFIIMDEYRDGFCCNFASGDDGSYNVTYGGENIISGLGVFEHSMWVEFVLPEEDNQFDKLENDDTDGLMFSPIGPEQCPNDVLLVNHTGDTPYPDDFVRIVSQDMTTVTVELVQMFTESSTSLDSVFYKYKDSTFTSTCPEEDDFFGEDSVEIQIECKITTKSAFLEIWVADHIGKGVLSEGDNAVVPQCCHPNVPEGTPVTKYLVEIRCDSLCPEVFE